MPGGTVPMDRLDNVPQQLSAAGEKQAPSLGRLLSGVKRGEIEECTKQCLPTCTRGGSGAPGLGPITMRGDPVVFKDGFRSRGYCLSECVQVCALTVNSPAVAARP